MLARLQDLAVSDRYGVGESTNRDSREYPCLSEGKVFFCLFILACDLYT